MSIFSSIACALGFVSEAREKAKKYAELEKYLTEQISIIETRLNEAKETLETADTNFVNGNGEAEGKIMTTFTQKESLWSIRYKEIILEMETGIVTLKLRKNLAAQKKVYWETQAQIEEMKANG